MDIPGAARRSASSSTDDGAESPGGHARSFAHDEAGSYFRRTSLAIAAARRFTLHESAEADIQEDDDDDAPVPPRFSNDPATSPGGALRSGGVSFRAPFLDTSFNRNNPPQLVLSPAAETPTDGDLGTARSSAWGGTPATSPMERPAVRSSNSGRSNTGMSVSNPSGRPYAARRRSSAAPPKYRWLSGARGGAVGDEPGVDVRSSRDEEAYAHMTGFANVTVVDYSSNPDADDTNVRIDFPGARLAAWLDSPEGKRPVEDGKPVGVRWIHITGLNWEVVKALTIRYQLHPLAVEDALRSNRSPRSKIDFYRNHMYLQILVQHIHQPDREVMANAAEGVGDHPFAHGHWRNSHGGSHGTNNSTESVVPESHKGWWWQRRKGEIRLPDGVDGVFDIEEAMPNGDDAPEFEEKATHRLVIDRMSAAFMVPIRKGIISIFMMRDGTLISIGAHDMREAIEPIYARLEDEHSLLRRSGDVSMLAHALLDVSVDLAVEISQAFEAEIVKAESKVLVHAQLELVRNLHVVGAQITRFRRLLMPLLHAAYVIRDQDTQRAQAAGALTLPRGERASDASIALAGLTSIVPGVGTGASAVGGRGGQNVAPTAAFTPSVPIPVHAPPPAGQPVSSSWGSSGEMTGSEAPTPRANTPTPSTTSTRTSTQTPAPTTGFFSPLTKVYMNDVIDHLEMVVSATDQYVLTADHLTDYVFNVLSFQTNNSMERLSIVTVLFLPLTFIASYFGMNFEEFPEIVGSVTYFWKIAAPCTVAFFVIFSFNYLKTAYETVMRRGQRWQQTQDIRQRSRRVSEAGGRVPRR